MLNNKFEKVSQFKEMFLSFDLDSIEKCAVSLLESGFDPKELLTVTQECIEEIGKKFESGEYFLPELVLSGEIFKIVGSTISKYTASDKTSVIGKIVIGTPQGDIHRLGKEIFCVLAEANGFFIYDLGVDVSPEAFVEKLIETKADILGMSALLTSTYEPMQEVVSRLEANGLRDKVFIIIGGSATSPKMVERLKVDAQSCNAYESVRILKDYVTGKGVSL